MAPLSSIENLPFEILALIFHDLSNRDILTLPSGLRVKGLTPAAARNRFQNLEIKLTKRSLEDLSCISNCPALAPAVKKLIIQAKRPRKSDRDDYLMWQWIKHEKSMKTEEAKAKFGHELQKVQDRGITMLDIHKGLGLERWRDCSVCSEGPPEHTDDELFRAGKEQEELEASETDVNSLAHALQHLPNLEAVVVDNMSKRQIPRPEKRWVNPRCSSAAHPLAVLFKALAAVGPTRISISTRSITRPCFNRRTQPVPILLSELLSEVSIDKMSSAVANIRSLKLGGLKFTQHESQPPVALRDHPLAEPEVENPTNALTEALPSATHLTDLFLGCTSQHRQAFQYPGHIHLSSPASSIPFEQLQKLGFVNFWFHEHHLRAFLRACPSLVKLQLEDIVLRPGTWYAVFRELGSAHARLEELKLSYFERAPHSMLAQANNSSSTDVVRELKQWLRGEVDEIPIEPDFELPRVTD